MVIRRYLPEDFSRVEDLWKETGIYRAERGDTALIILDCITRGGEFLVMVEEESGRMTGTSWMTWDGRRVYLHHFAIHPDYQQKGHGRALALRSIEFARQRGCPVKLEVQGHNLRAVNLYKSLGFKVFEDYEVYILNMNEHSG
jgi:ribosomal protein S18 acetylase RimI-like enzyme